MLGTGFHVAKERRVMVVIYVIRVVINPDIRLMVLALGCERATNNLDTLNGGLHMRKSTRDDCYLMPAAACPLNEVNPQFRVYGEGIVKVDGYLH
jgi:hypothetical protein